VELGAYCVDGDPGYTKNFVEEEAQLLRERAQVKQNTQLATSNVLTISACGRFRPESNPDQEYLTTTVVHALEFPSAGDWGSPSDKAPAPGTEGYRNYFECIPFECLPTDAGRAEKDRGRTFMTVGSDSERVITHYGRVRIRPGPRLQVDSERTCWARGPVLGGSAFGRCSSRVSGWKSWYNSLKATQIGR
jgi:uncharacterized protein involved in type VI secretion and phage assembly